MNHQALYRRYRPHSFKEVVGQSHITDSLVSQVKTETVGHAYLFAGSRGLGKTSIARIFAKELKVDERDMYEIDAASNNSVEDVRELTQNVFTLPFTSPYKIYILDEVHMFSKGAWNALLKTLEEPPEYAIFILATTELDKVPETVQSRCQVYEFKKPTRSDLAKVVMKVVDKEAYTIEPAAADLIALLADGSYRDALSVLERVLAFAKDDRITRPETEKATGAPRQELVQEFVEALSEGTKEKALTAIHKAAKENIDMRLYLSLITDYVRAVLLTRHAPTLEKELSEEMGEDAYRDIKKIADNTASKLTHRTLEAFLHASGRIRYASVPALPLELAVLELTAHDAV